MSDAGDNGGPASEKTLLDEFAGQALAAAIDSIIVAAQKGVELSNPNPAIMAYQIADQMIAEKRRRETTI